MPLNTAIASASSDSIGMVMAVEGDVVAMRDGVSVTLAVKDAVNVSDTIMTGSGSKVQILLDDESSINIGPDSNIELREFADAGKDSKFNAHIGQGTIRLITGRITEANPDGFKVTTPVATVGIRGTLLVFTVSKDHTVIDFQNSSKTLLVNGTDIKENNRIVISSDNLTVNKLSQNDKLANDSFVAKTSTTDSISEESAGAAASTLPGLTGENNVIDMGSITSNNNTGSSVENGMQTTSGSTGMIAGSFKGQNATGGFSFNVNLQSGAITNAVANGSVYQGSTKSWDVSGGSGSFTGGSFHIDGFTGTVSIGNGTRPVGGTTAMNGSGSYQNVGDTINGNFTINDGIWTTGTGIQGSRVS